VGLHRGEEEAEGDDIANDADDVAGHVGGNHDAHLDRSLAGNTTRLLGGANDLRKVGCDLFGAWVAELI
jgi:hypothetical protein